MVNERHTDQPAPTCTSAELEQQCLTKYFKRSALAAGLLIAILTAAAIVIGALR